MKTIILIIILILIANFSFGQHSEIHKVAEAGDLGKVRTLIEGDPTLLESKDNRGNTPLHRACAYRSRHLAVAKFLVDKGADVNARSNSGYTPLIKVCNGRGGDLDVDIARYLIAKGADVNAQSNSGETALLYSNLELAKLLIEHDADVNAINRGNYGTVLHATIFNDNPFVVGEKQEEFAILLIERGAKLNRKYIYGNTEIHLAAAKGFTNTVVALAKHGADVNAVNDCNHTALYYAAKLGYRATVDALIAAGADENSIIETNYGKAPQLTEILKESEAYIWHLGGLWRCGYAVKTKGNLLIFDKLRVDESSEVSLANGRLNPSELAGQKITLFTTKPMYGSEMTRYGFVEKHKHRFSELAKRMPDIDWILDAESTVQDTNSLNPPLYRATGPHEHFSVGDIKGHTIPALACAYSGVKGLGYLLEVDGLKIFHAGFHASQNQSSQLEKYRQEIDYLKPYGPIDIVFLTVNAHLWGISYEAYLYLIDQLQPKAIYLMGGRSEEYTRCANVLRARNIPVFFSEAAIAIGERFHYIREDE